MRIFSKDEFERIMAVARSSIWKARILLAKTAGLRRGEILNLTVKDVDFAKGRIMVQPKEDTKHTWRWVVKDKDRREVPLVDKAAKLLIDLQNELPDAQPYLLLPNRRYKYLMGLKARGKLKSELCKCPDDNFGRSWQTIFRKAGIEDGTFHDLRSTCVTEWLEQGLMPHEVKELAGHADINTTMNYYVGIRESLIDRARGASSAALGEDSSAHLVRAAQNGKNSKEQAASAMAQPFDAIEVTTSRVAGP